jgi:hypothetical protein
MMHGENMDNRDKYALSLYVCVFVLCEQKLLT